MFDYTSYLREARMPHIWCAGCGNGIIVKSLLRAVEKTGWSKDDIVMVSGIGCSSRTPGYVDFNTLHTTHGRALAFATGVKAYKPDLHVIVVSGDGDAVAIGGNHFIHACRRNIDITLVVYNNNIYGMTGGQNSPTTPIDSKSTTMTFGNIDEPFDIVQLALGAGASFVARSTVAHPVMIEQQIRKGLNHKGFSVIEVMANCPTAYGRRNKLKTPVAELQRFKDLATRLDDYDKLAPEERGERISVGIFREEQRPEFTERYQQLMAKVGGVKA